MNLLLNLPADFRTEPVIDEGDLRQLNMDRLSYADLQERVHGRPDQKLARSCVTASQADLKLQKALAFQFAVKVVMIGKVILLITTLQSDSVCRYLSLTVTGEY